MAWADTDLALLPELHRQIVTIREFETELLHASRRGDLADATHLCIGQEAVAAGAMAALGPDDLITSTHRGHGHCIAKGADVRRMMAELYGRASGYCRGRGGSMHIADFSLGICGANGIVGAGMPIANGVALAAKLKGTGQVCLSFFGDGAANQGAFHEALNLASIWKLPVVFVCENNQYAVSMAANESMAVADVADRAAAYAIPGVVVDGNDALAVRQTVAEAVARARAGEGPTLVECKTYRITGHYAMDPDRYRPRDERQWWEKNNDPVERSAALLLSHGLSTADDLKALRRSIRDDVRAAHKLAKDEEACPPEAETWEDLYTPQPPLVDSGPVPADAPEKTFVEALGEAIRGEMERDERVVLIGEDVGKRGGAFQVSAGMMEQFGPERVRDTPISEAAIIGCGVGAAMQGLRPVCEIMFSDFMTVAMDQIANQAAKMRYMFGGQVSVPLVIRATSGCAGRARGAQHSQSLEAWFMHTPGLKVVYPSTPADAKGLLTAAIRDADPVVFLEHKGLLQDVGPVPEGEYVIPLGKAAVRREGSDLTIVSYARAAHIALHAARRLEREGLDIEVIDLRSLVPLDRETMLASVRKTGRVLVLTEDCRTGSAAAEIIALVTDHAFDALKTAPVRITGEDVPLPYSQPLESCALPNSSKIAEVAKAMLGR
jgi:pyruvate/2-oxoglutarate/acetoin dehydrogenase E1 component/TPP-dependent pyruvate/acetoin dehydrogenase alpha subunit